MSEKMNLGNLKNVIRWEFNYNTLSLLASEKKALKRQGTNVVFGIY